MVKLNVKQKLIVGISIMLILIILAIVITASIVNKGEVVSESYSTSSANANSNIVASYIKSGVTIAGITGTLEIVDTSNATASEKDVLEGETFYAGTNDIKTGTMENLGAWTTKIKSRESVTIPRGYHDGNGTVSTEGGNINYRIVYNANIQRTTSFSTTVSGYTIYVIIYTSKDGRTSSGTLSSSNGTISSTVTLSNTDYDDGSTAVNGKMWIVSNANNSGTTFSGTIANAAWGTRVIIIGFGT